MTTTDLDVQAAVDRFNASHFPGSWVRYWTGTRDDAPKYGQTRTAAELLGGHTPVVWVTGEASCIGLTHVDPIPDQPDGIEDDSGDLPDPVRAIERVREYIAAFGDGIYDVVAGHPLYARDVESLRQAAIKVGEQATEISRLRAELDRERRAHVCTERCTPNAHVAFQGRRRVTELEGIVAEQSGEIGRLRAELEIAERDLTLAIADRNAMRVKLNGPCGSCHPCTNWADETWRAAGRKPPTVQEWDDLRARLAAEDGAR